MIRLGNDWDELLESEFKQEYYLRLRAKLKLEYRSGAVYPPAQEIFSALRLTAYQAVRVVILGQDPYHGPGQAHGLAFSVPHGVLAPPSLLNILREVQTDCGFAPPTHGCLDAWTSQGVLLLNAVLTVRKNLPTSHAKLGWEQFTDRVVELLNARSAPMVFLLWGNYAKAKGQLVTNSRHLVLTAAHPSPLSAHRGFFGCRHFSQANAFLFKTGQQPVDWRLPSVGF